MKTNFFRFLPAAFLPLFFVSCASVPLFYSDADYYQSVINSFNNPEDNFILSRESSENINSADEKFPDQVYVKTLSQTFMKNWQFVLLDGKIYAKKNGENEWKIFTKDGKPKKSDKICEIFADGDCLFAFDNEGRLFKIYTEKTTVDKTFKWVENFGWPQKTQLVQNALVSKNRGWAMGTRRRDVLWYEDIFGNQHHYGTMGLETIYFLSDDGQRILFTDSGLPNDFSKSIEGPEHGKFIARNISNSASTIFLIGDDGTMYTRLIDFDTMGCDPMFFKYTYKNEIQKYSGEDYLSNYSPWGLPAEPWKKESEIPLEGKARLTRFISIHQDGQGNFARELRVAGTNKDGVTGYYYKNIANEKWNFMPAKMFFSENDFLTGENARGSTTDFSYSGYLTQNGSKNDNIEISTDDFSLTSEGTFNLLFKMKKDGWQEEKKITLHNVMQWTYALRIAPGYDGSAMYYFITPDFDEDFFKTSHEEFSNLLKSIFDGSDKKTFAFTAAATTGYLEIFGNGQSGKKSEFKIFMTKKDSAQDYSVYIRPETYKAASSYFLFMSEAYNADNLTVSPRETYSQYNLPDIEAKIESNINYRKFINGELKTYSKYMRKSNISRWSYNFVDLITTVTLLNQIDFPKIKTMTSFGGRLLQSNAQNFKDSYEYRSLTAPHIMSIVDIRLKAYEKLASDIEKNGIAVLPIQLKNSYTEYFDEVKIPKSLSGTTPNLNKSAYFSRIDNFNFSMYPGFYISIGEGENEQTVVVTAKKAAKTIFSRKKTDNSFENLKKNPLKMKVSFAPEKGKSKYLKSIADISFISKKSGKLVWDGENLKITVGHFLLKETLFEGKVN